MKGFWIRPGDDFIAIGQTGDKTWAIRSPTTSTGVKLTQVSPNESVIKPARVADHRLQYIPKCPRYAKTNPSEEVLYTTQSRDVKRSNAVLLKGRNKIMHPKGDSVEWVPDSNVDSSKCASDYQRFAFVANESDYPQDAPLATDTPVNIRVHRVNDPTPWSLLTPDGDHKDADLKIANQQSTWRLYRTSGYIYDASEAKCKPWTIASGKLREASDPPYRCNTPTKVNGAWTVQCFTSGDQDLLFSTEEECLDATQKSNNGGGNNGGNNGNNNSDTNDVEPDNGGDVPKPKPIPNDQGTTMLPWIIFGGGVAILLIILVLMVLF